MIVVVTNRRDLTTDYVIRELKRRDLEFIRFNTDALGQSSVVMRPDKPQDDFLVVEGQRLIFSDVTAGYFRRPEPPDINEGISDPAERAYCSQEWAALLKTILGRLSGTWFNDPGAIVRAEDKPRQLVIAHELGFDVPATLVTNDAEEARAFILAHNAIVKPLRQALLDPNGLGKVMFTSRVTPEDVESDSALRAAPFILQAEVKKRCDLRVTVVADQVFAASIQSQDRSETAVDWRRGSRPDLPHAQFDLPDEVRDRCLRLTESLGLAYGAIDLVLDENGTFWFLEINPNGQWAWIEERTGLPIAAAIVGELAARSQR